MFRFAFALALLASTFVAAPAEARVRQGPKVLTIRNETKFLKVLDHDGYLSAGWVQVLPVLATSCNFRLDNSQLTNKLVDLSRETGNVSYTRDLYTTLYMIQTHGAKNNFVAEWTARFDGRQKEACDTAEALWGDAGHQFPGVLKREAMNDGASVPPGSAPNNCK